MSLMTLLRAIFGNRERDAFYCEREPQKKQDFRREADIGMHIQVRGSKAFIETPAVDQDELRGLNGELETPSWFRGIDRRG